MSRTPLVPALALALALTAALSSACRGDGGDPAGGGDGPGDPTGPTDGGPPTGPGDDGDPGPADGVTYWRDVQPILAENCVTCHRAGDVAPFSLETYDQAVAWAEPMRAAVESGTMPPWPPSEECMPLVGERRLAPDQIAAIGAWVDQGLAEGDPADGVEVPEMPAFDGDLELQMPEAYTPEARGDDYRCFVIDWPQADPAYVTAYEVEPGRRELVHHVILFTAPPGFARNQALNMDQADPGPGYTCFGSSNVLGAETLGGWVPGVRGVDLPAGTGVMIEPGTAMIVQVHYNTLSTDDPAADTTRVAFRIAETVEHPASAMLVLDPLWLFPGVMSIPAGESSVVHDATFSGRDLAQLATIDLDPNEPFRLHRVSLHMHTLGKRSVLRWTPAGTGATECVIDIPDWDFSWQGGYELAEPVEIAPDDEVQLLCEWDNSAPGAVDVDWGDGTGDEMCLAGLYVTK